METHGISAIHPDEFVGKLRDRAPLEVCAAARRQRLSLKRPPKTVDEFPATFERQYAAAASFVPAPGGN